MGAGTVNNIRPAGLAILRWGKLPITSNICSAVLSLFLYWGINDMIGPVQWWKCRQWHTTYTVTFETLHLTHPFQLVLNLWKSRHDESLNSVAALFYIQCVNTTQSSTETQSRVFKGGFNVGDQIHQTTADWFVYALPQGATPLLGHQSSHS